MPAQEIANGRVRIEVVEGYVAEVEIAGDAGPSANLALSYGEKLKAVRPLTNKTLERYLLLANDIPGTEVRAVLGEAPETDGGVKLTLAVTRRAIDAQIGANNRGSRALGRERGFVGVVENGSLFGRESIEVQHVRALDQGELAYTYARATTLLGSAGTRLGLSASIMDSEPGTPLLTAIDFNSEGFVGAVEVSHPFVRSRALNVETSLGFERQDLTSRFGSLLDSHDELSLLHLSARADFADPFEGITRLDARLTQGINVLGATTESDLNKSRSDGSGAFTSLSLEVSRLTDLGKGFDLWLAAGGQASSRPLLASQECGYGGARFGRAFDNFEISGETCAQALAEIRYSLPELGGGVVGAAHI